MKCPEEQNTSKSRQEFIINLKMLKHLTLILFLSIATSKIIYAIGLIRHGVLYPKQDYFAPQITSPFKSELTPTGYRQLYNLGTYLREVYIMQQAFLPKHFDGSIEFFSTSLQRTQLSACSLIYGLYPLNYGLDVMPKIPQELLAPPYKPLFSNHLITEPTHSAYALRQGLTPAPVHILDQVLDSCADFDLLSNKRAAQMKENISKLQDQNAILIEKMRLLFSIPDQNKSDIEVMSTLYRALESDHYIGLSMPQNLTYEDQATLKFIYEYYNAQNYEGQFGRIFSTLPFQFMRSKLTEGVSGKHNKKMVFISLHSSNMWPIMVNLNLTSSACIEQKRNNISIPDKPNCEIPQYASNLIVQVHEDEQTLEKAVRIKFNGNYMKMCQTNHEDCPLQEFLLRLEGTEQDYDLLCGPRPGKGYISPKK